jgi:hypothetical protein
VAWQGWAWHGVARHGLARQGGARQGRAWQTTWRVKVPPKFMTNENETRTDWPLWKAALAKLRGLPEFGYGLTLDVLWFERELNCQRDTTEFTFALLNIRQQVESENGYYLQSQTVRDDETGTKREIVQIPCAADHENIAHGFETRMRSYSTRAVDLRVKTLANPEAIASMTAEQKAHMEKAMEIAAVRTVLIRRERSIVKWIKFNSPKLLED